MYIYILQFGGWTSKIKGPADSVPGEGSHHGLQTAAFLPSHGRERKKERGRQRQRDRDTETERGLFMPIPIRTLVPSWEPHP